MFPFAQHDKENVASTGRDRLRGAIRIYFRQKGCSLKVLNLLPDLLQLGFASNDAL